MSFSYGRGFEPWIGRRFDTGGANAFIGVQILRWLNIFSYYNDGPEIFYEWCGPAAVLRSRAISRFVQSIWKSATTGK